MRFESQAYTSKKVGYMRIMRHTDMEVDVEICDMDVERRGEIDSLIVEEW
jgi:hypothetical protein